MTRSVNTITMCAVLLAANVSASPIQPTEAALPAWAVGRWTAVARGRSLVRSKRVTPDMLRGDFDGDGAEDLAMLVEGVTSHKVGIVVLHRHESKPYVVGAGTTLGNGGDNFDWMDSWRVQARVQKGVTRRVDALLVEREGSGGGLIYFAGRAYHWRQAGD